MSTKAIEQKLAVHGLKLGTSGIGGRSVYADKSFSVGDHVAIFEPYAYTIDAERPDIVCHYCFRNPQLTEADIKLKRCGTCKFARYCSVDCQKKAWEEHSTECKSLCRIAPNQPTNTVLLAARVMNKILKEQKDAKNKKPGNSFDDFLQLQSHADDFPSKVKNDIMGLAHLVNKFLKDESDNQLDIQLISSVIARIKTNSLSLMNEEMHPSGTGLYIPAAFINHSCTPNCVVSFSHHNVRVKAIADIPQGAQITISYVEIVQSKGFRHTELLEGWYFTCNCPLCVAESPEMIQRERLLQGFLCQKCRSLLQLDYHCEKCNTQYSQIELLKDKAKYGSPSDKINSQILETADENKRKALLKLGAAQKGLLKTVMSNYDPHADIVIALLKRAYLLSPGLEAWDDLMEQYELYIKAVEAVTPPNYPLGSIYAQLGKTQMYFNLLDKGLENMRKAEKLTKIWWGDDCALLVEIRGMIEGAQQEILVHAAQKKDITPKSEK